MRWNSIFLEGFAENLQASGELTAHNRMPAMGFRQRTALILDVGAKVSRRELELQLFDTVTVGVPKEKPDHEVVEYTIDEDIDDLQQPFFTELLVQ